jgi:hypothetical protein
MIPKIKRFVKENKEDILLFIAVVLVSMFSFSLGYIIAKMEEKEPLQFEQPIYIQDNK